MNENNNISKEAYLASYKESLKDKTLEELRSLEQEIITEADANDTELQSLTFPLPVENYENAANAIRALLSKQSVSWQYAGGLMALYDYFNPTVRPDNIPFPMFDSLLRILGGLQYTGPEEWHAVITVSEYVADNRDTYVEATEKIWNIASRHDVVMKEIELRTNVSNG